MLQAFSNVSNKIWVFVDDDHGVDIVYDLEQQLTLKLTNMDTQLSFMVTFVYAKCDSIERIELWDSLYNLASDMSLPWLVGGDFNVIWDEEEKFGGLPVSLNEINDFRHCISTCNLGDPAFKGSIYMWWNRRGEDDCIFKRLDRCLGNIELQHVWPSIEVTHLSKIGSDHSPMLLKFNPDAAPIKKTFKFLNFWCKHSTFKDVVLQYWKADFVGDPFFVFNHKLKKLKKALSIWSRATYDGIFQRIATLEEVVLVHEAQFESEFFQAQFHEEIVPTSFDILDHVPTLVNNAQNLELVQQPTKEEVRHAVFGLNGESAGGPDGFTGCFFQFCWDIIGDDIVDMVKAFFNGCELPRYVTHTNLVLLPKKKEVITFSDMRLISLRNFVNKMFSRVVHERLAVLLPNLISEEQAGFVKGMSIVENVLLTQEIITDIRLRTKVGPNVVTKLDMDKAYDRLSWLFLTKC
ncbi:uncharacterized protein [Nicotiana sylvestris]|uniref:Uncharacterized protein LOC104242893 n=1 Tax=Nicotiana sylvestris TaxID=4096 RepID=A0A1U7XZJ4_NICSY|nr:PREDICTED: uncharacterized protein LOC104242893 [Nicotiana sylvestris]